MKVKSLNGLEYYIMFDATDARVPALKDEAELYWKQLYQNTDNKLSIRYNLDGTKGLVKVVGETNNWWAEHSLNGDSMILGVWTRFDDEYSNHSELKRFVGNPENGWTKEDTEV